MARASKSSYDDMLSQLECPVCFEPMYPPIFQCPNGHIICSKCKPDLKNHCPTCRAELGDIRSLALEKFAANIGLPCRYNDEGCDEIKRYEEKEQHELTCRFRPYGCPFPCFSCPTTGDIGLLVSHLGVVHESTFEEGCVIDTVCRLRDHNGNEAFSNLTIYKYVDNHFCLNFEAFCSPTDLIYKIYLTFMGEEVDAQDYRYTLEIGNDTESMTWQGVPRSIREKKQDMRKRCNGLIVHRSVAQTFSETYDDNHLAIRVRGFIWRLNGIRSDQDLPPHTVTGRVTTYGFPEVPIPVEQFDFSDSPYLLN